MTPSSCLWSIEGVVSGDVLFIGNISFLTLPLPAAQAHTFWLPAGCKPTSSLEKIAASIFDFHSKNLWCDKDRADDRSLNVDLPAVGVEEVIPQRGIKRRRVGRGGGDGAEWWIQIRREGEHADLGMPFHWDKDEQLLERHGALVCPAVSTVTYLSDYGAPTVVFKVLSVRKRFECILTRTIRSAPLKV